MDWKSGLRYNLVEYREGTDRTVWREGKGEQSIIILAKYYHNETYFFAKQLPDEKILCYKIIQVL